MATFRDIRSLHFKLLFILVICILNMSVSYSLPDQGKWSFRFTKSANPEFIGISKSLYNQSTISIKVTCDKENENEAGEINIAWVVRQTPCFEEYMNIGNAALKDYFLYPYGPKLPYTYKAVHYMKSQTYTNVPCQHGLELKIPTRVEWMDAEVEYNLRGNSSMDSKLLTPKDKAQTAGTKHKRAVTKPKTTITTENRTNMVTDAPVATKEPDESEKASIVAPPSGKARSSQIVVDRDGVYLLVIKISIPGQTEDQKKTLSATVDLAIECPTGYLSAEEFPLLPFYGVMCLVYLFYGIAWLVVSACQWRELLRIQFWIGGVILLGMLEKAVFYAEYQSINSTGTSVVQGAVICAEIVSCFKRTLARMLVIIVSLGFGIVKPRLGPMLHRVLGVGALYFILGTFEACSRVLKHKNDPSNQSLMASIPLAVLDSAICWWVFSSLVQTTRTLRLRRNVVKLSLYRHFTNTLIFAVLASVAYMIWSIRSHRLIDCLTDWKELWVDEAYWHLLFSVILLVIMVLWRPNNNNQRYAFTPLLDMADEEDEADITTGNDAFAGMTLRGSKNANNHSTKQKEDKLNDDLKWVEENIPSSLADTALPSLVDSEEEIMTTKFELSKME